MHGLMRKIGFLSLLLVSHYLELIQLKMVVLQSVLLMLFYCFSAPLKDYLRTICGEILKFIIKALLWIKFNLNEVV